MFKRLQDLPIKRKMTLVILVTCAAVLLLASAILAGYQMFDFSRTMVRDTTVLANILGESTQGALKFGDEDAASNSLRSLVAEPVVVAAAVYTKDGTLLAGYTRMGDRIELPKEPPPEGRHFEPGALVVIRPVMLEEKHIGTVLLRKDLQGMYDRLYLFGFVALLVLLGSSLVVFVMAAPLQRPITEPILTLTQAIRQAAQQKDYSVRLAAGARDETGILTQEFNQLLASIEDRDKALRSANDSLRGEVLERKNAEDRVQAQLARLQLLQQITRATSERLDLPSIFQVVVRTIEEQLPVDFCCICLRGDAQNTLVVKSSGLKSEKHATELAMERESKLDVGQNGLQKCLGGRLIYEPDTAVGTAPFTQRLAQAGLLSFVAAPLLVESQVFGLLLAAREPAQGFSSGECEFLRQLSEQVGLAAHQAQLHEALQQAYDDLRQSQQTVLQQERLRALGQMASGIAHDINNAISPVALYTESLLETETNLSPRARDYLVTIQSSIEDVAHTVSRMREFYRQREPQLNLTTVPLNNLVQQVLDLSRARWSDMSLQRGVVIESSTELASDLPPVRGIESEIREALLNLVFNAVDAMPEGGKLTIRTRVIGGNGVAGNDGTQRVAVEVSDTGVGMSEDTRRRCLEPFFTTKGERGTGLGLAMVYGIAQRHSAEIEIDSEVGQGTTLRLVFPAAPAAVPAANVQVPLRSPPSRLRILIIDDDPLLLKSLRDTLEIDGHAITPANGGQAGIDAFMAAQKQHEPFSVVITDLGMPYIDGRKVAAAIKAASPTTPILLLTGWGERMVAEGDIPPNVNKVLNKPPKLRMLREALAACEPAAQN